MSASGDGAPAPFDPQVAVLAMVQISVTLAVAVLVTGRIFNALPSSGALSNASTAVQNQTATAFELAPIVLVVIVASLVIATVRRV